MAGTDKHNSYILFVYTAIVAQKTSQLMEIKIMNCTAGKQKNSRTLQMRVGSSTHLLDNNVISFTN